MCHKIVKFKCQYYEEKSIDALARNNVAISRSSKFLRKKEAIRNYLEEFELLSNESKRQNLIRTMVAINSIPLVEPI